MRTIALEEHFWTPELAAAPGTGVLARANGAELDALLRDVGAARLTDMDAAGIDVQVLSHVQPAAQAIAGAEGGAAAQRANDYLAAVTAASDGRLAGFATLPTGSPAAAAEELLRCVLSLGFVGGLVNSTIGVNGAFLDDPSFDVLLSRFESLDVPLYLHPAQPPAAVRSALFAGLAAPVAGALATNAWGWHAEAGLHTLRLAASGTFARHPGLRVIIGHCGEMLPFMLDRVDDMMPRSLTGLDEKMSEYIRRHVWVTTSGMFSLPPALCALSVFGADRVLFSVDYPFSPNRRGREFLESLPVPPADKVKIAGGNAAALLRLPG
ncbi:MAG TPA: amidohydrolase family protein [Trebonia sp.]|nr:amidohydrolase family protein [Trebonia sp.]